MKSKCQNCEKVFEEDQLNAVFPFIGGLAERLTPGELVPVGECPECYSLTHTWKEPSNGELLLCPGLQDPECAAAAEAALEKRNHADYQCYMLLKRLVRDLRDGMHPGEVDAKEMFDEAAGIIDDREHYNDKFMQAVAGRK